MAYPEEFTKPMREELINAGIKELLTEEQVIEAFQEKEFILFINSVCGCSAGVARPAIIELSKHTKLPIYSVFAGVHRQATTKAREYLESEPSSPSISLIKNGKEIWHYSRSKIQNSSVEEIIRAVNEVQ